MRLESLESRTLLTYTFTYGGVNGPQTVNETGGSDSFTVVNNGFGLLEWSTDPTATPFSTQWGAIPADTLNASPAVTLTINQAGDNSRMSSSAYRSPATSSASAVQAHIVVNPNPGLNGSTLTIDDSKSTLGDGTYTLSYERHRLNHHGASRRHQRRDEPRLERRCDTHWQQRRQHLQHDGGLCIPADEHRRGLGN